MGNTHQKETQIIRFKPTAIYKVDDDAVLIYRNKVLIQKFKFAVDIQKNLHNLFIDNLPSVNEETDNHISFTDWKLEDVPSTLASVCQSYPGKVNMMEVKDKGYFEIEHYNYTIIDATLTFTHRIISRQALVHNPCFPSFKYEPISYLSKDDECEEDTEEEEQHKNECTDK